MTFNLDEILVLAEIEREIGRKMIEEGFSGKPKDKSKEGFIYVPSIDLYVAKERTLLGENFYDSQEKLHSNNQKMLNLPEFKEFLKYTKENHQDIYNEITEVRSPWRTEWIDADFKMDGDKMLVNYHVFDNNGNIVKKSEKLDKNTLRQDKTPGISLDDYLNRGSTSQGIPKSSIKEGDLYYWAPEEDNNAVAGFSANSSWAYLNCNWNLSDKVSGLGVRAAEHIKGK